jgi:hypothetical protein
MEQHEAQLYIMSGGMATHSVLFSAPMVLKQRAPDCLSAMLGRDKMAGLHQIVLKISLKNSFFLLDSQNRRGVLCAAGGKKWPKVG